MSLVDGALDDGLLAGRLPLVDALVGADVADAVGVHLHERVVAERVAAERGRGAQEARVRHLLHGLPDGEHECCVYERHYDVGIVFLCNQKKSSEVRSGRAARRIRM